MVRAVLLWGGRGQGWSPEQMSLCPQPSVLSGDRQSGQPPSGAAECFSVGLEVAGGLCLLRDPVS